MFLFAFAFLMREHSINKPREHLGNLAAKVMRSTLAAGVHSDFKGLPLFYLGGIDVQQAHYYIRPYYFITYEPKRDRYFVIALVLPHSSDYEVPSRFLEKSRFLNVVEVSKEKVDSIIAYPALTKVTKFLSEIPPRADYGHRFDMTKGGRVPKGMRATGFASIKGALLALLFPSSWFSSYEPDLSTWSAETYIFQTSGQMVKELRESYKK
jgi:hypothetical protein